jgi:hypothetical protein
MRLLDSKHMRRCDEKISNNPPQFWAPSRAYQWQSRARRLGTGDPGFPVPHSPLHLRAKLLFPTRASGPFCGPRPSRMGNNPKARAHVVRCHSPLRRRAEHSRAAAIGGRWALVSFSTHCTGRRKIYLADSARLAGGPALVGKATSQFFLQHYDGHRDANLAALCRRFAGVMEWIDTRGSGCRWVAIGRARRRRGIGRKARDVTVRAHLSR